MSPWLILFLCLCASWSSLVKSEDRLTLAMSTLDKAVHYLNAHLSSSLQVRLPNAIIAGQLMVLSGRMTKSPNGLTADQLELLRAIHRMAEDTSHQTQALDEQLFGQDSWQFFYPSRLTDPAKAYRTQGPEILSDRESQYCLDQITGSNKFKSTGKCSLSSHCWKTMTAPDKSVNYLTQELLYLTNGENHGCQQQMDQMAMDSGQPNYQQLYEALCATIKPLAAANGTGQQWVDQVYSQMLFCGILGFRDFFSSSSARLDFWSALQMADGCIGDQIIDTSAVGFLQKLFGAPTANCVIERTAVVASLLTQYLRFYLEDPTFVS